MSTAPAGIIPEPNAWPCWAPGVPEDAYHAHPSASSSFLRTLTGRSPAHARAAQLEPREETPALMLGRAIHARALEPGSYPQRYAVAPKVDRRTKAGKATWEEFTEAHPGAVILSESDGAMVEAIGAALEPHPLAPLVLSGGAAELSGFFTDPGTGAPCRIRPDYARLNDGLLADLKTTTDASPREFARAVYRYGYHVQAAFYALGFEVIEGRPLEDFLFIAIEKAPPYAVGVYRLDDEALAVGRATVRKALNTYAACLASGHWPAYSEAVEPVTLPAYAFAMEEAA